MVKKLLIAIVGLSFLIGCTQMMEERASLIKVPEVAPGAEYLGTETCLECHEDHANDKYNVHMRIASFEVSGYRIGCEGCHGPGSAHVDEDGDVEKILRFGKEGLEGEEVGAVCTTCHQDGALMAWAGSAHQEDDVSCLECHSIHYNKEKTLLRNTNQFELCGQCHQDIKAKGYLMSRHPVREGKMGCTDCHSPHGTDNLVSGMIKTDERLNDLCLKCHTRYQGPFVFEHEPVIEDCTFCHDAHGTVANNLLLQNEPFLCLQCHEAHFHSTRFSGQPRSSYPPGVIDPNTGQTVTGDQLAGEHNWQAGFLTQCTSCHQNVHGSDLPSQSVSGQGTVFTR